MDELAYLVKGDQVSTHSRRRLTEQSYLVKYPLKLCGEVRYLLPYLSIWINIYLADIGTAENQEASTPRSSTSGRKNLSEFLRACQSHH